MSGTGDASGEKKAKQGMCESNNATRGWRLVSVALTVLCLSVVLAGAGCSSKTPEEAKAELEKLKKKEKPKPNFDELRVFTEPNERAFVDPKDKENQVVRNAMKPGHWSNFLVDTRANNFDFSGEVVTEAHDDKQNPLDLNENNTFHLNTARPAGCPRDDASRWKRPSLPRLRPSERPRSCGTARSRNGGEQWRTVPDKLTHMPAYQYYLIALRAIRAAIAI